VHFKVNSNGDRKKIMVDQKGFISLESLQNLYLSKGLPFVSYRLPDTEVPVTLLTDSKIKVLEPGESLPKEVMGFTMASFIPGRNNVWFEASQVLRGNTIQDDIVSDHQQHDYPEGKISLPDSTSREEYDKNIKAIIDAIKASYVKKVVLSRTIKMPFDTMRMAPALFDSLMKVYSKAFVYIFYYPGTGLWIGASPELLLQEHPDEETKELSILETMALAGTRLRGELLYWNEKEIDEHEWVKKYISSIFDDLDATAVKQSETYTSPAGNIEHLRTDYKAFLERDKLSTLINMIHPTPAVCGWPKSEALSTILKIEKHERSFYSGYLGPVNIDNFTRLYVNLRCMQMSRDEAVLYVGGGITGMSNAEDEWNETEIKSRTLLSEIEKIQNLAQ
jgi:isochorismate synthase